jgi:hypothetical protein
MSLRFRTIRFSLSRALTLALTFALILGVGSVGLARPVHAASGILTCVGTENQAFDPAVTNNPGSVRLTIDDRFGPCPITPDPQLTGGTFHLVLTRTLSCTNVMVSPPHPETYQWNNGSQSVVEFTTIVVTRLLNGSTVAVLTGTVTSGLDMGFAATKTVTDPDFSTVCDSPEGMTTLSGSVTIAFL